MKSNRKENTIIFLILGGLFFLVSLIYFGIYLKKNKVEYLRYNGNSIVDYNVYLKENQFYKSYYQSKNKDYVASLIDYIETSFKYDLSFNKNIDYKYSYKIIADVNVYNSDNNNSIYNYKDILLSKENQSGYDDLQINQTLKFDYMKYNSKVKSFLSTYNVSNTKSVIDLKLIIDVNNIVYNGKKVSNMGEKVVSTLEIPLNVQTVSIDISNSINNKKMNRILIQNNTDKAKKFLYISLIACILFLFDILGLILYIINTASYQTIYRRKIRSINSNYSSNIQRVEKGFTMGPTKPVFVKEFSDILEIGINLKKPILCLENKKKTGTLFIVPPENGIAFAYLLSIKSIKAKKEGKILPDVDYDDYAVDVGEIKFTKENIDKKISETRQLQILDKNEIVEGSDNLEDLYNQFDKTLEYKNMLKKIKEFEEKNKKTATTKKATTSKKTTTKKATTSKKTTTKK